MLLLFLLLLLLFYVFSSPSFLSSFLSVCQDEFIHCIPCCLSVRVRRLRLHFCQPKTLISY